MTTNHLDDLHFGVDAKLVDEHLQVLLHLYTVVFDLCTRFMRQLRRFTESVDAMKFIIVVVIIVNKSLSFEHIPMLFDQYICL